jgi:hypothetical protein
MTLDQLLADLHAIRCRYGGEIPVVLAGHALVIRASVEHYAPLTERVQAALEGEEDDLFAVPHVVLSYRNQQGGKRKRQGE